MALDTKDLQQIEQLIEKSLTKHLEPVKKDISELKADVSQLKTDMIEVKTDISEMKKDMRLLANLNQLDEIRKEPRLRTLYSNDQQEA